VVESARIGFANFSASLATLFPTCHSAHKHALTFPHLQPSRAVGKLTTAKGEIVTMSTNFCANARKATWLRYGAEFQPAGLGYH
jgi:hypothetical protein